MCMWVCVMISCVTNFSPSLGGATKLAGPESEAGRRGRAVFLILTRLSALRSHCTRTTTSPVLGPPDGPTPKHVPLSPETVLAQPYLPMSSRQSTSNYHMFK